MQQKVILLGLLFCTTLLTGHTKHQEFIEKYPDVFFENTALIAIEDNVIIRAKTKIGCGVHLIGNTIIGQNCTIGHYTIIKNCTIGDNVIIESHCVLENTTIKSEAQIGPFAHISESSTIDQKAIIGNFVEVKRSYVGSNTKAKHLAYLGDVTLGENVNIGGGTIFCNYNGVSKQITTIDNHAFIGSNSTIVAPLHIGKNAMTAAGSTITENVPNNCLAIARSYQINKYDYVPKLLEKYKTK